MLSSSQKLHKKLAIVEKRFEIGFKALINFNTRGGSPNQTERKAFNPPT